MTDTATKTHKVKRDFTMSFRQMFWPVAHGYENAREMYSYDRVSAEFWSAFMNGLMDGGMTEEQAADYLCSKSTRWALDGSLGDAIERLAYKAGKAAAHD